MYETALYLSTTSKKTHRHLQNIKIEESSYPPNGYFSPFINHFSSLHKTLGRGEISFINALLFHLQNNSIVTKHKKRKWVSKTRDQWGEEIGYSRRQIARIIHALQIKNLICIKKLKQVYGSTTNSYSINENILISLLSKQEKEVFLNQYRRHPQKTTSPKISILSKSSAYTKKSINNKIHHSPDGSCSISSIHFSSKDKQ